MQSFCAHCAVCVLCVYLAQITWFVAAFALDQRRVAAGSNGCVPCIITHEAFVLSPRRDHREEKTELVTSALETEKSLSLMERFANALLTPFWTVSLIS